MNAGMKIAGGAGERRASAAASTRLDADIWPGSISSEVAPKGIASLDIKPQHLADIDDYITTQGKIGHYERELHKIAKKHTIISGKFVDDPGVIPKTLDEVYLTIQRFRIEEQPKIEKIMDVTAETIAEANVVLVSVDATVKESKNLMAQLNTSLAKAQGWFDFLVTNRVPLLIGCAAFGFLVIVIMVTVLIVLIRMALA